MLRASLAAVNCLYAVMTLMLIGLLSATGRAGNTWDGGGSNNNWTTGANWNLIGLSQTPPANNGTANVVMAGTVRLTPNVDAAWDIRSLTFNVLAGAFTIESSLQNALTIGVGGIVNQSGLAQTVDAEIALSGDQTWTAQFGALQINGDVSGGEFHSLTDLAIAGGYDTILNGRLAGLQSLTKTGALALLLNGTLANTYTGTTYVNQGSLWLNKQVADGAIRGDLVIGDGVGTGCVTLLRDEQIFNSTSRTVTVNSSGVLDLNGFTETIHNLEVRGGRVDLTASGSQLELNGLTMQGGIIDGAAGMVTYPGRMNVWIEAAATTAVINTDMWDRDSSQPYDPSITFFVSDGEAEIDLDLTGSLYTGFTVAAKAGCGAMRVHGGRWRLDEGTLVLANSVGSISVAGGTIRADTAMTLYTDIDIVGAATIDGPHNLFIYQSINGTGGLTKRGTGTLYYGMHFVPNTYAGATVVEEGMLVLASEPLGPTNTAIVGNLVIGDGQGGPEADVVRLNYGSQIASAPGRTVTVNSSRLFDLNGQIEAVQDLIVDGGMVRVGASGSLIVKSLMMDEGTIATLDGTLVTQGNISTVAAAAPASISGKFSLDSAERTFSVPDGAAPIDLDVSAVLSNGSLLKTSPGTLRLAGANTFAGGVTVSAGTLVIDSATGSATGTGPVTVLNATLAGAGTIAGSLESNGLVSPGASPGTLNIGGNYTQTTTGELLIELTISSYDQLLITGDATLAGTLTVSYVDGFTPSVGQTFTILTADNVIGEFDTEPPQTSSSFGFDVIYNAQSVVVSVVSTLPGDYNGDGVVDAADYTVWRKFVGAATLNNRDQNSMGPVGQADYDFWQMHFGETIGSSSGVNANATVPEPATLLLMMFAATGWCIRRGRAG